MNKNTSYIGLSLGLAMVFCFFVSPVFGAIGVRASIGVNASTSANQSTRAEVRAEARATAVEAKITNAKARADQEITRRIDALNKLVSKVDEIKNVSGNGRESLSVDVQNQITALNSLKTKIDADTSTTTLKEDIQSITKSYRIFALIIPRDHIIVAADRITTTADLIVGVGAKLQTRIGEAQANGKNVTALQSALADLNSKSSDAKNQAIQAVAGVSTLNPDKGDTALAASDKTALVAARANIKAGTEDLKSARKDIDTILKTLKGFNIGATASSSASASTTTQ